MSTEEKQSARAAVIIPARLHSTRLPQKLLLRETGKPLIQHTYEAASTAKLPCKIAVAADSQSIVDAIRAIGGNAELTSCHHESGSDRIAEVAAGWSDVDIIVNVQGDEPEVSGESIDQLIKLLETNPHSAMATLATPIRSRARLEDPSCVKVVFDNRQRALYFSRAAIPYCRTWDDRTLEACPASYYQHIGVYAYRRSFLLEFASLPRPAQEQLECLEQLRALFAGEIILVQIISHARKGIDTCDDYKEFVGRWFNRAKDRTTSCSNTA